MSISVLLTSAKEDSEEIVGWMDEHEITLMHLPLERYVGMEEEPLIGEVFESLEEFETIVYGSKRNAIFFLQQVKRYNMLSSVKERVNLTLDETTADYMEQTGIPAICTFGEPKPINLVEFMLRLRRTGQTLYPCGSHAKEEIPGLLEELGIPIHELEVYDLKGPIPENLREYRSAVAEQPPDVIIFHSRKAVNRIQTAFPGLDFAGSTVISADTGVSNKLEESGISITAEADGSWQSVIEKLNERV